MLGGVCYFRVDTFNLLAIKMVLYSQLNEEI